MAKDSPKLFGVPIADGVHKQLERRKKIVSHNSSILIIPGPEIDIASLDKYLNILDLDAKVVDKSLQKETNWKFLDSWYNLNSISNDKNSLSNFVSYPPQEPAFNLYYKLDDKVQKPYAMYLDSQFENPLILLGEKQQIRYALWNSVDLASLKYKLTNSELNYLFENSMRKITNWLMKKNDNREFVFRTNKNSYQHGELVSLTGVSSDLNDNFKMNDVVVELFNKNQYLSSKPILYDLNDKSYRSNFWAPKPGEVDYVVKVNRGIDSYEVYNGSFKVQESHIELNKIFLNKNKLIILSEASGGLFKNWEDRDEVISALKEVNRVESNISFFTFRYNYFYMFLIFLLLSFEWFYRKKIGLI